MFEIDSFYLIILSVALFILIAVLGFMGWMLSHQKDQIDFPNITTTCPDFWEIDSVVGATNGYCKQPTTSTSFNYGSANSLTNYIKTGTTTAGSVPGLNGATFNSKDSGWGSGKEAVCAQRKWANDNNIKWDTVTNVNFC
jgi:hypothetical protein